MWFHPHGHLPGRGALLREKKGQVPRKIPQVDEQRQAGFDGGLPGGKTLMTFIFYFLFFVFFIRSSPNIRWKCYTNTANNLTKKEKTEKVMII